MAKVLINNNLIFEGTLLECRCVKNAIELLAEANKDLFLSIGKGIWNPTFESIGFCDNEIEIEE